MPTSVHLRVLDNVVTYSWCGILSARERTCLLQAVSFFHLEKFCAWVYKSGNGTCPCIISALRGRFVGLLLSWSIAILPKLVCWLGFHSFKVCAEGTLTLLVWRLLAAALQNTHLHGNMHCVHEQSMGHVKGSTSCDTESLTLWNAFRTIPGLVSWPGDGDWYLV